MAKKKIIVLTLICAVFIIGISVFSVILSSDIGISTGNILVSSNGSYFLIRNNTPIRLSAYSEQKNALPDLENGDKVLVIHDGIAESYPASTLCRFCIKVGNGNISDIPKEVISTMTDLGWLSNTSEEIKASDDWENIDITKQNANISLALPEGWKYSENSNPNGGFAVKIYHHSDPENNVAIEFTESFGVCGTGLRTEEIKINKYRASMGIYDNNPTFNYIVFDDTPGFYVIYNNGDVSWWQKYENELKTIFSSIRIAEGIIFRDEALTIAKEQAKGEYKQAYNEYSFKDGVWTFTFEAEKTAQSITVDKDGNILYNAKT